MRTAPLFSGRPSALLSSVSPASSQVIRSCLADPTDIPPRRDRVRLESYSSACGNVQWCLCCWSGGNRRAIESAEVRGIEEQLLVRVSKAAQVTDVSRAKAYELVAAGIWPSIK